MLKHIQLYNILDTISKICDKFKLTKINRILIILGILFSFLDLTSSFICISFNYLSIPGIYFYESNIFSKFFNNEVSILCGYLCEIIILIVMYLIYRKSFLTKLFGILQFFVFGFLVVFNFIVLNSVINNFYQVIKVYEIIT